MTILNSTTKDDGQQLTMTTASSWRLKFIGVAKTEPKNMNVNVKTASSIDIKLEKKRSTSKRSRGPAWGFLRPTAHDDIYARLKIFPLA